MPMKQQFVLLLSAILLLVALLVSCRSRTQLAIGPSAAELHARADQALVEAVKRNDAAQVAALLRAGADLNARDDSGQPHWRIVEAQWRTDTKTHPWLGPTVLMIACHEGRTDIAAALLRAGADPNALGVDYGAARDVTDDNIDLESHVTPLVEAVFGGSLPAMTLLLHHGANVNAKCQAGMSDGMTASNEAQNMVPTGMGEMTDAQMDTLDRTIKLLEHAGGKRS